MKKNVAIALILLFPVILFSQVVKKKEKSRETATEKSAVTAKEKDESKEKEVKSTSGLVTTIPVQSKYSNKFKIKSIDFNKAVDYNKRGEILEVQFVLQNLTDDPMDLYVFTIATYEKKERTRSSLEPPVPPSHRVRSFVPFPDDITNFQYQATDKEGQVLRDRKGKERTKLLKFPKNPKAGIDPGTGKPYHLKDKLVIRATHLSKYRSNYFYFNEAAVLIFDDEGKLVFRQLYKLDSYRR